MEDKKVTENTAEHIQANTTTNHRHKTVSGYDACHVLPNRSATTLNAELYHKHIAVKVCGEKTTETQLESIKCIHKYLSFIGIQQVITGNE